MAHLKSIAECLHVRIITFHKLESVGNDSDWPCIDSCQLTGLEAEIEVPWMFGVQAESIHRSFWVGFRIGSQPFF